MDDRHHKSESSRWRIARSLTAAAHDPATTVSVYLQAGILLDRLGFRVPSADSRKKLDLIFRKLETQVGPSCAGSNFRGASRYSRNYIKYYLSRYSSKLHAASSVGPMCRATCLRAAMIVDTARRTRRKLSKTKIETLIISKMNKDFGKNNNNKSKHRALHKRQLSDDRVQAHSLFLCLRVPSFRIQINFPLVNTNT